MKTIFIVTIVVAAHVVAIAGVFMMQGCGTPMMGERHIESTDQVVMPPLEPLEPPSAPRPALSPVRSRPTVPPARTVETTGYVVRRGDTISGIAHRYGLSVSEIVALNQLDNKNLIRVGQTLLLPGKIDVQAPPPSRVSSPPSSMARTAEGNYVIQKGDTLSGLAVKFGTTVGAIRKANNLSGDAIFAGQKLMIPGAGEQTAPAATPAATAPKSTPEVEALEPEVNSEPIVDMPTTPAAAPAAATATPAAADGKYRIYVVGEDEDLYTVGLLWNTSVEKIKELNNLTDTKLQPGQRLKIPYSE